MSPTTPLHARLWSENLPLAEACLEHPFVQGLARGDLDRDAFRRYVGQDAFFLRAFFAAYAIAAARCAERGRLDVSRGLHQLMDGVLEELDLHAGFSAELGIDLEQVEPDPATSAYTDHLLRTAWSGTAGEIFATTTPCMRLYAYLGTELADHDDDGNPYREWIRTYASPDFAALAARLERLLDELAEPSPAVRDAYRYAMECELAFFSSPLESPAG